jgi:hypothetical protein
VQRKRSRLASAPVRLGAYGVILAGVLGAGALVGAAVGPDEEIDDHAEVADPTIDNEVTVDGYDVTFDGDLVAGTTSEITITVGRDGRPVTDLQPHAGALGQLVAMRDGDLAPLHVHRPAVETGPGGAGVRFAVDVPSTGTYRLYFDFTHDGATRTARIVTEAVHADAEPTISVHDWHGG